MVSSMEMWHVLDVMSEGEGMSDDIDYMEITRTEAAEEDCPLDCSRDHEHGFIAGREDRCWYNGLGLGR
jgi:hypothetical protein